MCDICVSHTHQLLYQLLLLMSISRQSPQVYTYATALAAHCAQPCCTIYNPCDGRTSPNSSSPTYHELNPEYRQFEQDILTREIAELTKQNQDLTNLNKLLQGKNEELQKQITDMQRTTNQQTGSRRLCLPSIWETNVVREHGHSTGRWHHLQQGPLQAYFDRNPKAATSPATGKLLTTVGLESNT